MVRKKRAPRKRVVRAAIEFPSHMKLNPIALGYTLGILHAVGLAGLTVLAKMSYAVDIVELAEKFHLTYNLTPLGIISGLAETALWGIVLGYIFGRLYNKFA